MQVYILFAVAAAAAIIWVLHPMNLTVRKWAIRGEFMFYAEREKEWRKFRHSPPPARRRSHHEQRILAMSEWEFEEWVCSTWAGSKYWYTRRKNAFNDWHYERQFEIQSEPSPTDEMQGVIYMHPTGRRA
jgi:hypothetical protein